MRWVIAFFCGALVVVTGLAVSGSLKPSCNHRAAVNNKPLPNHLHVRKACYSVSLEDQEKMPGLLGTCNSRTLEIKIASGQKPPQDRIVLMHELLHAVFYQTAIGAGHELEEYLVKTLAKPLYEALAAHGEVFVP